MNLLARVLILIVCQFSVLAVFAQSPEGINYQAVLRDGGGTVLASTSVTATFSIVEGSASGPTVYSEMALLNTNGFGLISHTIGTGVTSDDFSAILWGDNSYFLNVKADAGTGEIDLGTTQLVSVPYALQSKNSTTADTAMTALSVVKDSVIDDDASPFNELQTLSLSGSNLSIQDGNTVTLPGSDLSLINGDSLGVSGGNGTSLAGLNGTLANWGFTSGFGSNPTSTYSFLSRTITLEITSPTQKVYVSANKAFGSSNAAGANGLGISAAFRISGSTGNPTAIGGSMLGHSVGQGQRINIGVSAVITNLAPGTYEFGMAGSAGTNAANWNSNEFSYVSVLVFN